MLAKAANKTNIINAGARTVSCFAEVSMGTTFRFEVYYEITVANNAFAKVWLTLKLQLHLQFSFGVV